MTDEQPKIIADEDWKAAAQAEKAKLKAADEAARERQAAKGELPDQIGFEAVVRLLATQALMYLGAIPDPSGRAMVAPDLARLHIDMLGVIQQKTKGNLSDEEQKLLDGTVHELRLTFVEVNRAVEQAAAEGKLQGQRPANPADGGADGGIVTPG